MAAQIPVILTFLLVVLTSAAAGDAYHGRVVDAATKQPLPGAVVTVIWMKAPILSLRGVYAFHEAREALTDADGRFSIDATPSRNWNPFRSILERPEIIVFKPGYGRYHDMYLSVQWAKPKPVEDIERPLQAKQAVTIELPKLTTERELRLFASPSLHPNVPHERVPLYLELVNEHAVSLGLERSSVPGGR